MYTTVRSLTDETVQPQGGRHPTSSLEGASNILIQSVCPGRTTSHIGTAVDSVTFAALVDAIAHGGKEKRGAAKVSRFPPDVCSHPYALTHRNDASPLETTVCPDSASDAAHSRWADEWTHPYQRLGTG
jgi:hypothetical protein